jgi:hypothetical protein
MKLKDITPEGFCSYSASCPAIFETDNNTFVIIGKVVSHPDLEERVGEGEAVVEVSSELVLKALGTNHLEDPR